MGPQHQIGQCAAPRGHAARVVCANSECSLPAYQVPISGLRILGGSGHLHEKPRQVVAVGCDQSPAQGVPQGTMGLHLQQVLHMGRFMPR